MSIVKLNSSVEGMVNPLCLTHYFHMYHPHIIHFEELIFEETKLD